MDGVTSEIAEEIGPLLANRHFDAGTREEKTQHDCCRPAARDGALDPHC